MEIFDAEMWVAAVAAASVVRAALAETIAEIIAVVTALQTDDYRSVDLGPVHFVDSSCAAVAVAGRSMSSALHSHIHRVFCSPVSRIDRRHRISTRIIMKRMAKKR